MSKNLSPISGRVTLPPSPIPPASETRDAAVAIIEAEQWLQSNGWRDAVTELASPDGQRFLAGFAKFRARALELELERDGAQADARRNALVAFIATAAAALGYIVIGFLIA